MEELITLGKYGFSKNLYLNIPHRNFGVEFGNMYTRLKCHDDERFKDLHPILRHWFDALLARLRTLA